MLRGLQKYLMVRSGGILGREDGSPEIEIPPSNIHIPKHQHPAFKTPTIQHPYSKQNTNIQLSKQQYIQSSHPNNPPIAPGDRQRRTDIIIGS